MYVKHKLMLHLKLLMNSLCEKHAAVPAPELVHHSRPEELQEKVLG